MGSGLSATLFPTHEYMQMNIWIMYDGSIMKKILLVLFIVGRLFYENLVKLKSNDDTYTPTKSYKDRISKLERQVKELKDQQFEKKQ